VTGMERGLASGAAPAFGTDGCPVPADVDSAPAAWAEPEHAHAKTSEPVAESVCVHGRVIGSALFHNCGQRARKILGHVLSGLSGMDCGQKPSVGTGWHSVGNFCQPIFLGGSREFSSRLAD
jgi:hypothetical protein